MSATPLNAIPLSATPLKKKMKELCIKITLSYCLKCGENTEDISPLVSKVINGGTIILSKCAVCNTKKARFIKKQEAKGFLSNLGIRTILSKIPILRDVLF